MLVRKIGAPVVPVFTHRDHNGKHHVRALPALPPLNQDNESRDATILQATAEYTAIIEQAIRQHPEQWTWVHRRWK